MKLPIKLRIFPLSNKAILPAILILFGALGVPAALAQSESDPAPAEAGLAVQARVERARALAAAHQLTAAAAELESLRTTVHDDAIHNIATVMLMSICLEEGNYARAESLLEETFKARQVRKDASIRAYFALAGQAVNGARAHLARYRSLGINVGNQTLPKEALNDLERLRALLERMSFQAREIGKDQPKRYESLALLEDILGIRLTLARDDEDRAKWEVERASVRQGLVFKQSQVASLGSGPPMTAVMETAPQSTETKPYSTVVDKSIETKAETPGGTPKPSDPNTLSTGSLNQRATRRVLPVYPQIARNASAVGVVRVYVTLDEQGNVSEVAGSEGPALLRGAAEDAARRWKFSPTTVAGKFVRLSGFIEFNFTL